MRHLKKKKMQYVQIKVCKINKKVWPKKKHLEDKIIMMSMLWNRLCVGKVPMVQSDYLCTSPKNLRVFFGGTLCKDFPARLYRILLNV